MTPIDFLVLSVALMPTLLAALVWWYVTHTGEDLSGYRAVDSKSEYLLENRKGIP